MHIHYISMKQHAKSLEDSSAKRVIFKKRWKKVKSECKIWLKIWQMPNKMNLLSRKKRKHRTLLKLTKVNGVELMILSKKRWKNLVTN